MEYAVYKGDEFQFIGTVNECAARLGVKPDTVKFYSKPAYMKRLKDTSNALIVIKIEEEEDE